jgi:hypothetical protein
VGPSLQPGSGLWTDRSLLLISSFNKLVPEPILDAGQNPTIGSVEFRQQDPIGFVVGFFDLGS